MKEDSTLSIFNKPVNQTAECVGRCWDGADLVLWKPLLIQAPSYFSLTSSDTHFCTRMVTVPLSSSALVVLLPSSIAPTLSDVASVSLRM